MWLLLCAALIKVLRNNHVIGEDTRKTFTESGNVMDNGKASNKKAEVMPSFVSIDGGLMREMSQMWGHMKELPAVRNLDGVAGFSNLHSKHFKPFVKKFKQTMFGLLMAEGVNMVIPDTAADFVAGVHDGFVASRLRELKANGQWHALICC